MQTFDDQFIKLDELLSKPVPNFKSIELELESISPASISIRIMEDVGFAFLLDYYFRYIGEHTVRKILQNPLFSHEAVLELFYCQMTSIEKAIVLKRNVPELFSSYWKYLSKAEYAIIFKSIMKKTTDLGTAKSLLQKVDLLHLRMMVNTGSIPSENILKLFKKLGPELKKLIAKNIDIYDFAFELAVNNSDLDFLAFLEEYTTLFVKMRLASTFVEEVEKKIVEKGKNLSFQEIHAVCLNVPKDCIKVTLEIFQDKGWISPEENKSIDESLYKPRIFKSNS